MSKRKYTEEEIQWAINKLKEKNPSQATREGAIELLDTFQDFVSIPVDQMKQDKKSGKLKQKKSSESKN